MLYLKGLVIKLLILHNHAYLLTSFDRLNIIKMQYYGGTV